MDNSIGHSAGAMRAPTIDEERERLVPIIKDFRKEVDALMQRVPGVKSERTERCIQTSAYNPDFAEAYHQVRVHLVDAKMWAGKLLEHLGNPFPAELADKAPVQ